MYTDGITETRDADGAFYPLLQRLRARCSLPPPGAAGAAPS
ncbi:serine/threonine-protein phosphatase [Streptomyces tricolor]|nr:serine/threonine-protein phosphatase [Streptomyces tricolor]